MFEAAVIGSGGRESELGRQLAESDEVEKVYFLNGNAGTDNLPKGTNVDISPTDIDTIIDFSEVTQPGLVVIGPEAPLVAGLADRLRVRNIKVFGPSAEAARLEGSKAFAVEFMREFNIPHPPAVIATNFYDAAIEASSRVQGTYVIKADGIAGGKGVVLPESTKESDNVLYDMLILGGYEGAGKEKVLVQERYHGPEVSAFVVSDGTRFTVLPFSQDHKRLQDGDKGPNTGGMGAYSPLPDTIVSPSQEQKIYEIAEKSIAGMSRRGTPFKGLLYIGLMLAEELDGDPAVIEFNARFGDPETQVVLPLLSKAGVDVSGLLRSVAEGRLENYTLPNGLGAAALTVCLAAPGYPSRPEKGATVLGLDNDYPGVIIHHAGTKKASNGAVQVSGGRVLYVTGIGKDVDDAANKTEVAIGHNGVWFPGMQYRTDIGHQARTSL